MCEQYEVSSLHVNFPTQGEWDWLGDHGLLQRQGQLGELAPGAFADLLLVDGDPLADLNVLCGQGERIDLIMRGGVLAKSAL